jgi:PAS domain S-box-containing protein
VAEQVSEVDDYLARMALVARGLAASLRPSEVVEIVVRQGMAGLGAEGGVLALVAPDGLIVPVETVGYSNDAVAAFAPMHVGQELPLTVAVRDAEPVWVPSREDAAARFPALVRRAVSGSHAWAAIPLVTDGLVTGVLGVSFLAPRAFSDPERLFISALGDQCALALAVHRSRRASHLSGVGNSSLPTAPQSRAPLEFPIKTLVVRRRRNEMPDVAGALREDSRFSVDGCDDHEVLADLMRDEPVDLVVVSSDLPTASRIQIADMVRAQWPEAVLVLQTGDPTVEKQARVIGVHAVFGLAMPEGLLRAALVALVEGAPPALPVPIDDEGGHDVVAAAARARSEEGRPVDAHTISSEMFARSLDAVMFTAPDGRILAANPAACSMLGLTEAEIRARGRAGLADAADPRWAAGLAEREETGRFFGELSMVRGDGTIFPAEVSSAVFENEFGELRTVVVLRDLSDRARTQRESEASQRDELARDRLAQTLLEVAMRRLWSVGTSLQAGLQGPPALLIARAQEAIDELDDTIRELRTTLLSPD